jgi:hypothetical protein
VESFLYSRDKGAVVLSHSSLRYGMSLFCITISQLEHSAGLSSRGWMCSEQPEEMGSVERLIDFPFGLSTVQSTLINLEAYKLVARRHCHGVVLDCQYMAFSPNAVADLFSGTNNGTG